MQKLRVYYDISKDVTISKEHFKTKKHNWYLPKTGRVRVHVLVYFHSWQLCCSCFVLYQNTCKTTKSNTVSIKIIRSAGFIYREEDMLDMAPFLKENSRLSE